MSKYNIWVSDRVLEFSEESEAYEWQEGTGENDKLVESHDTLKECFDSMSDWGSRWAMYPAAYIETEEAGEVWESTPMLTKCSKCKHEEWEQSTSQSMLIGEKYSVFEDKVNQGLL